MCKFNFIYKDTKQPIKIGDRVFKYTSSAIEEYIIEEIQSSAKGATFSIKAKEINRSYSTTFGGRRNEYFMSSKEAVEQEIKVNLIRQKLINYVSSLNDNDVCYLSNKLNL